MDADELKAKIKNLFMAAAKDESPKGEEHWVIMMMEQDHWSVILERLEPDELALVEKQMEQEGSYPSSEVNVLIDEVEVEVFGRVICE